MKNALFIIFQIFYFVLFFISFSFFDEPPDKLVEVPYLFWIQNRLLRSGNIFPGPCEGVF
ncbi:hypothetical protein EO95_18685 [Methanosarcina sp. 1.H.T.1A.1]|nr:hypothetical protein EO95_18685 [Methanosarcina sp. 1.H.T.1A.1]